MKFHNKNKEWINFALQNIHQSLKSVFEGSLSQPSHRKQYTFTANKEKVFQIVQSKTTYFLTMRNACHNRKLIISIVGKLCAAPPANFVKQMFELRPHHGKRNKSCALTPLGNHQLNLFLAEGYCKQEDQCFKIDHGCHQVMFREWWDFKVHPHLKMNITQVVDLKFTIHCSVECLLLLKEIPMVVRCLPVQGVLFATCGRTPQMSISPHTHDFSVLTVAGLDQNRHVELQYSVIDANWVSAHYENTFPLHNKEKGVFLTQTFVFGPLNVWVKVFSVQTFRHLRLRLHILNNSCSVWILDGPGPLCSGVHVKNNTNLKLSAFISQIYVLFEKIAEDNFVIRFSSQKSSQFEFALQQKRFVRLDSRMMQHKCRGNDVLHCVAQIKTTGKRKVLRRRCLERQDIQCLIKKNTGLFLNISVQEMKVSGPNSDNCLFAGLSIRQPKVEGQFDDNYKHIQVSNATTELFKQLTADRGGRDIMSLCDPYNASASSSPKPVVTISSTDQITIVFYCFTPYVLKFQVSLLISTTECQGIFVDLTPNHDVRVFQFSQVYSDVTVEIDHKRKIWINYDKLETNSCVTVHLVPNYTL